MEIVSGMRSGGREEVVVTSVFLNRIAHPYYAILDRDAEKELLQKIRDQGLPERNFYFLSKGEIEDYLVETTAIATLVNQTREEVEVVLARVRGRGKERLDAILRELGISKVSSEVKELLARQLPEVPAEIRSVIKEISTRLGSIAEKDLRA